MRIKWFSLVRITGLVLVLTYHFFQTQFTGGFIGVDIFFTFSGFLITSLMVDEFARSDNFKLMAFYGRRFYRIVPPLFIAVLLVLPLTYLIDHDFVTDIGKQVAAALGFTTNYFEIATGGSYENKFIPHLFVHTWSLAVEMHFYILWGLIAWLVAKISRRLASGRRALTRFRWGLGLLTTAFAIESFVMMYFGAVGLKDFSPVYFSSLTHCFPFFVGGLIGVLSGIKAQGPIYRWTTAHCNSIIAGAVMLISFILLVALGDRMKFDALQTYQGGLLLATVLAGIMIYGARLLHDHTPNLKEPRWMTFLADVSYSVYLYHWPLYVIFSHMMVNWLAALLTTVLSIILSALSYYVLEPVIAGKRAHVFGHTVTWRQLQLPVITAGVLLAVNTGVVVKNAPQLSTLEQNLWVSGIYQDIDKIGTTHEAVLAAVTPKKKQATPKGDQEKAPGVSIIGDSVTLGTRSYLGDHVANSNIDAEGDRTMNLAYKVMMNQQRSHTLRQYVVICIGTNALDDYEEQTMKIIHDLEPGHKLILMTPYNARADADWNSSKLAVLERRLPAKYKFITVADWGKIAAQHPEVFKGTDGVHFGGIRAGDILYAKVINQALTAAKQTPAKPA
ncbi:acyltransferase family protein [Lactiplantibacillus plantarum]|nr:acyltransferase family protein [Lactiplantibacillus plantarum]MBO2708157.1 acyltransferase family protein [Lactiplantibacillus plantarum]